MSGTNDEVSGDVEEGGFCPCRLLWIATIWLLQHVWFDFYSILDFVCFFRLLCIWECVTSERFGLTISYDDYYMIYLLPSFVSVDVWTSILRRTHRYFLRRFQFVRALFLCFLPISFSTLCQLLPAQMQIPELEVFRSIPGGNFPIEQLFLNHFLCF